MSTTRYHICEMIQRALNAGFASDDTEVTINLVNQYLNSAVAFAAKAMFKESIQIDGIEDVQDAFYASFPNISISLDSTTGLYQATLPQQPAGVSRGWDIAHFMLITGSGKKIFANPISPTELVYLYEGESGCNEVYYFVDGATARLHSCQDITKYKANVRMIATQSSDLTSPMSIPDTALSIIIDYIAKTLGIQLSISYDTSEDGVPTNQVK